MNEHLIEIIISLVIGLIVFFTVVIKAKNKTIKDLIARQSSTHKSLVQVQDNYHKLASKQEFGIDDKKVNLIK
jgi:hypothetical protein